MSGDRILIGATILSLSLSLASVSPLWAGTGSHKSDHFPARMVTTASKSGWTSVIVQGKNGSFTDAQKKRITALGGDIVRNLPFIDSVAVRIPSRNTEKLTTLPFVRRVSPDGAVKKNDVFTVDSSEADTAKQFFPNVTGATVTVAVIDSGVTEMDDLKESSSGKPLLSALLTTLIPQNRLIASKDFVSGDLKGEDKCGHGTHVAGIIAGNGDSSSAQREPLRYFKTISGIAPRSSIVNVRVLNEQGEGTVSGVIAGVQWVVANKAKYGIRVINLSLGHPAGESYKTDPLCLAVEKAWKAGIVVVCAAGNDGRYDDDFVPGRENEGYGTNYGSIQSPGNSPYVITVGALKSTNGNRQNDTVATYSSRGPSRLDYVLKPDLVAPGNRVMSLNARDSYLSANYPDNQIERSEYEYRLLDQKKVSRDYFRLSGTSMSAPVVAAAAALMLQKEPNLTPDTVKARLMISADKWGMPDGGTDPCTFGAGYLNIASALQSKVVAGGYALSPTLSQDEFGNVFINTGDIWGTRGIWDADVSDLRAIWGRLTIWNSSTNLLSDSRAIWGRSVWSDRAIWGRSAEGADLSANAIYGED
jgi:serine protease AprX